MRQSNRPAVRAASGDGWCGVGIWVLLILEGMTPGGARTETRPYIGDGCTHRLLCGEGYRTAGQHGARPTVIKSIVRLNFKDNINRNKRGGASPRTPVPPVPARVARRLVRGGNLICC